MRIFTENTDHYIHSLSCALEKDPASLERWRCVHIQHVVNAQEQRQEALLQHIRETHPEMDCDILYCPDNDVLLISRELSGNRLLTLASDILCTVREDAAPTEIMLYEMHRDRRALQHILLSKYDISPATVPQATIKGGTYDFGEIAALQETFAETKKLRAARHPLHVMLVEDDPLTKRIVTGSLKQSYALITAQDAHEAIANYLLYAPDIVFLDIGLPDTNGFAVLQQLIKSDPQAYIVMFSGNSYLDNVTDALNLGASGFVAKPFRQEQLQRYIMSSAAHHHKTQM